METFLAAAHCYSVIIVLDDSDEEQVVVTTTQTKSTKPKKTPAPVPAPSATASSSNGKKEITPVPSDNNSKSVKTTSVPPSNNNKTRGSDVKPKVSSVDNNTIIEGGETVKENNRGGKPRGKDNKGGRGGPRESKPAEGGEEQQSQSRRPKREYERRSGTGRGREISRGGRGSYGLGNDKQDALEAEKDPASAEPVVEDQDEEAVDETIVVVEEPEPETLTMDQFMERRNEARAKALEVLGDAKTRSVSVEQEFSGLTTKDDETEDYMGGNNNNKGKGGVKASQRSSGKNQIVDVSFKFEATVLPDDRDNNNRGDRGGRGRGRDRDNNNRGDGRGRGGRRPPSSSSSSTTTTVFNAADFPSL